MRHQALDDDDVIMNRGGAAAAAAISAQRAAPSAAADGSASPTRPGDASGRPSSPPWMPVGPRPGTQSGSNSARRKPTVSSGGARGGRAVEHTAMFLDDPKLPANFPSNFFWVYASYDFKMQTPPDQARQAVFKTIDRLMERLIRYDTDQHGGEGGGGDDRGALSSPATMLHAPPIGMGTSPAQDGANAVGPPGGTGATAPERPGVKAHFIFDIISTKKHITPKFDSGQPYLLGQDIYRYLDERYGPWIVTSFVGISDNTASRVGRDVYYSRPDGQLSRAPAQGGFAAIDNEHMYIVFPPTNLIGGSGSAASPADEAHPSGAAKMRTTRTGSPARRGGGRGSSPRRGGGSPKRPRPGR